MRVRAARRLSPRPWIAALLALQLAAATASDHRESSIPVALPVVGKTILPPMVQAGRGSSAVASNAVPDMPTLDPGERASGRGLDLGPAVIRSAIAEADRDWSPARGNRAVFGTAGPSAQARLDRRFAAAAIESCGGAGAFKFDPPVVGPLVFGGLLSIPWLVHAMATGRCRLSLVSPLADGVPAGPPGPASNTRPPDRAPFTDRVLGP